MNENDQPVANTEEPEEASDGAPVKTKNARARASKLYANELASFFAGLTIVAIALLFLLLISFAFGFWPGLDFPGYLITTLIVLGVGAFLGAMYFVDKAEEHQQDVEKESAYVINKWRISTLSTAGIPEDIIAGLKSILSEKKDQEEKSEMVMKRPFEFDAWIFRLGDLLGEERVIQYEDQLLRHTKTRIKA